MMMIVPGSAMRMIVFVRMGMVVTMVMDVFVAVFHGPVCMLMGMHMHVIVIMQMIVFVLSFHCQSSYTDGCCSLSSDSNLCCFKGSGSVCQRINRLIIPTCPLCIVIMWSKLLPKITKTINRNVMEAMALPWAEAALY
jgi:hypothetical protein